MLRAFATLSFLASAAAFTRARTPFDASWRFHLGDLPGGPVCDASGFTQNYTGVQCMKQTQHPASSSLEDCANKCACDSTCLVYQFCSLPSCGLGGTGCWLGSNKSACTGEGAGWVSFGRDPPAPAPPVTPPCKAGACAVNYDDAAWRVVNTPHDFVVEGAPSPDADRGHGFLPWNISWYRKHFTVDAALQGAAIWLDFDGVYKNSDMWLNGVPLGHHTSGYTSFRWYIHNATNSDTGAPALLYGGADNVLAVRADALSEQEGWVRAGRLRAPRPPRARALIPPPPPQPSSLPCSFTRAAASRATCG